MANIVAFIRERLEEDKQRALAASPGPWHLNAEHDEVIAADDIEVCTAFALSNNQLRNTARFIAHHDPERILRDVEADLAVLFEHDEVECCSTCLDDVDGCPTFRALAYKHATHPDWQPHWKPEESR